MSSYLCREVTIGIYQVSGLKGGKLKAGDKEADKVSPVEFSSFQPDQEPIQMMALYEHDYLFGQLLEHGEGYWAR